MGRGRQDRIELGLDAGAAALFASAVAFAAAKFAQPIALVGGGAVVSLLGSFAFLRRVAVEDREFALADFAAGPMPSAEPDELLLTEADHLVAAEPEALVLDDVLAELEPDSRVVRLFDPSAMPTPGQLKARIDRHLNVEASPPPDASQALHDALADLRRSLR